jgi:hypothetical protein
MKFMAQTMVGKINGLRPDSDGVVLRHIDRLVVLTFRLGITQTQLRWHRDHWTSCEK